MARQLHALREALRQRISSLPRHLESDPSLEFEERPNWCDALHAADEIEDHDLVNFIARALAPVALRGSLADMCGRGPLLTLRWEQVLCINGPLGMIMIQVCHVRHWIRRDGAC